jgi:hypothetical protein
MREKGLMFRDLQEGAKGRKVQSFKVDQNL